MVEVETLDITMTWKGLSYAVGQHGKIVVGVNFKKTWGS
jgi:hypothetical protein